jgi:hypothetical protein
MAPVLKALLEFLRIIAIARDFIKRFPSRGASLLAFLGRKLRHFWLGNFRRPRPVERSFPRTEGSSSSVSGGSAVVREYVVAASYVPPSASHPNPHGRGTEGQPATVGGVRHPPVLDTLTPHALNPHLLGERGVVNRSSGNLSVISIQSRASDRLSIITNSRESIRAPHGQPSRLPRAPHRQFGRGPDPSRSRERATRPSSPTGTTRPHTPTHPPSNLLPPTHGDGRVSPVVQPEPSSSYTHQPRSHPHKIRIRRRGSTTSVILGVQTPSTESLSITHSSNLPQITDEPLAIDSPTVHSSPDSSVMDLTPPRSPTSSNHPTMDCDIPDGRSVELINSEQIPRYTKNATM